MSKRHLMNEPTSGWKNKQKRKLKLMGDSAAAATTTSRNEWIFSLHFSSTARLSKPSESFVLFNGNFYGLFVSEKRKIVFHFRKSFALNHFNLMNLRFPQNIQQQPKTKLFQLIIASA